MSSLRSDAASAAKATTKSGFARLATILMPTKVEKVPVLVEEPWDNRGLYPELDVDDNGWNEAHSYPELADLDEQPESDLNRKELIALVVNAKLTTKEATRMVDAAIAQGQLDGYTDDKIQKAANMVIVLQAGTPADV